MMLLQKLDRHLLAPGLHPDGWRRALLELLYFGVKQARACLFAALFFLAVFLLPRHGLAGVPRYDLLLLLALLIQGAMLYWRLETRDELKAVCLFHAAGFMLELFKTSGAQPSWSYPDFAYSKLLGVPLFSGFMYAAVGSYIIQIWRLLALRIEHHPPYWMASLLALLIYANFFSLHYIGDYRGYLAACAIGLYAQAAVCFRPLDRERKMPLLLGLVLVAFFVWLAENISTFFAIWHYPSQVRGWSPVHLDKWRAWSLLVLMSFTIVANLKHIKQHVSVAR